MSAKVQPDATHPDYFLHLALRALKAPIPNELKTQQQWIKLVELLADAQATAKTTALQKHLKEDSGSRNCLAYIYECFPTYLAQLAYRASEIVVPTDLLKDKNFCLAYETAHAAVNATHSVEPLATLLSGQSELQQQLAYRLEFFETYLQTLAHKAVKRNIPKDSGIVPDGYEEAQKLVEQEQRIQPMEAYLGDKPELQERLAFLLNFVPSRWLLGQEIPVVIDRRRLHGRHNEKNSFSPADDPYTWARENKLQGLCFSGGGIRSATFNLGILQGLAGLAEGLANLKVLDRFDYLSSVSGGGYIHEWFAAWVKHEDSKSGSADGLKKVQTQLRPLPGGATLPFQPEPIRWLRRYSNYLTPQKGFFSADTWVAIAIWLRNTFLNQLVLISGLFFLVLLPHELSPWMNCLSALTAWQVALGLFLFAAIVITASLHAEYERVRHCDMYDSPAAKKPRTLNSEPTVRWLVVLPLLLASVLILIAILQGLSLRPLLIGLFSLLTVMIAGIAFAGGVVRTYKINHGLIFGAEKKDVSLLQAALDVLTSIWRSPRKFFAVFVKTFVSAYVGSAVINAALAAAAGTAAILGIYWVLGLPGAPFVNSWALPAWVYGTPESPATWRVQLTFGPPLFLFVPFLTMVIAAGLVGRNYPDWLREWLARVRAWSLLFGFGWMVFFAISLLGSSLFCWFGQTHVWNKAVTSIKWSAVLGWVGATVGGVMAGNSKKASGTPSDSAPLLNLLAVAGPYIFILGLLILLSHVADAAYGAVYGKWIAMTILLAGPLVIFLLFGWRVDINDFSMNSFYRNRLTRCYLGATNLNRDPNPVTGFDDRDTRGMQISKLQPMHGYSGPLPIICSTLNLTFGEDLAWQERKAASFAFSPVYSGYTVGWTSGKSGDQLSFNGFVPTSTYYEPDGGINIAAAVAISGAAASPNDGYHTNPATAFLMTMFNVRLGWWILNPRRSRLAGALPTAPFQELEWPSPRFSFQYLVGELLGRANDQSRYVYLSDGGHFENMGLYELIRRRCYDIVICDAESDEKYVFEGLGNAIRKCRIDFGVEIKLNKMIELRPDKKTGNCRAHFATGSIRYPETPDGTAEAGTILYIKSSLTGPAEYQDPGPPVKNTDLDAESLDILNYKLQHHSFPHDTTANQWYTESQFESYRRLGQHVVEEIQECGGWKSFC